MNSEEIEAKAAPAIEEMWALVEIFGHRQHYGRVSEVEKFGTKMMRVDVPDGAGGFEALFYGGASVFSMTPMTEAACMAWAERRRPKPFTPVGRLPPPEDDESPF